MSGNTLGTFGERLSHSSEAFHKQAELSWKNENSSEKNIAQSVAENVLILSGLLENIEMANELGMRGEGKTPDEAEDLIALSVLVLNAKDPGILGPNEKLLQFLYKASHNSTLSLPKWFKFVQPVVNVQSDHKTLPTPEGCGRSLSEENEDVIGLVKECDALHEAYEELRREEDDGAGLVGPSGNRTCVANEVWTDKQDDLASKMLSLEVNPVELSSYVNQSNFNLAPNAGTITQVATCFEELGKLIVALVRAGDRPLPADLTVSQIVPAMVGEEGPLSAFELKSLASLSSVPKEDLMPLLPQLLASYVQMRGLLVQAYKQFNQVTVTANGGVSSGRAVKMKVDRCLGSLFPTDDLATVEALMARNGEGTIQKSLRELLFSKDVGDGGSVRASLFIANRKYTSVLPEAMKALIEGDERSIQKLKSGSGEFTPFVEFGSQIRRAIKPENRKDLAELFDERLERCATKKTLTPPVSSEERLAVLIGLAILAEDEELAPLLKTRLRRKGLIADLTEKISVNFSNGEKSQGEFIGNLTVRIEQSFQPKLEDYWGQDQLKKEFRAAVEEHLELLERPDVWDGLESKRVFFNGHAVWGAPGVGKGFLLECLANELGLPIEKVTREALEETLSAKKTDSAKKAFYGQGAVPEEENLSALESAYAQFLDERIEAARDKMKKFGSIASFLFVDEMEAEFLNRDEPGIDQAQINRTNIMLRVIEKKVAENPDILFVGATNYIYRVDEAGLRVGRYGMPWEIKLPQEEDAKANIAGNFNQLGIDAEQVEGLSSYKKLVHTFVGLTPLTIAQAINNYVCLLEVRGGRRLNEVSEEVLEEIIKRTETLKGRFAARDQALRAREASLSAQQPTLGA